MPSARDISLSPAMLVIILLAAVLKPLYAAKRSVLVLGGSGFRGHLTSELLVHSGHHVTVLSRGRPYWGVLENLLRRGVVHWRCNRTIVQDRTTASGLAACSNFTESRQSFDAVVDFSSRSAEELKQVVEWMQRRVGIYIFISSHAVYDVAKATHELTLAEPEAVRPGREVSPLERFELKGNNPRGNDLMECEEELLKQYNAGGFPYTVLRLGNVFGPKENTLRYWLLHLWVRAHLALRMPMHLDVTLLETPISMTYTPDIAQAVLRIMSKVLGEVCCREHVEGEAFNLACEETPNQRTLYNYVAEPMGLNYVETTEIEHNRSIVLYPEIVRGPLKIAKALDVLGWAPTDLQKAIRSVARFYDRVMLDESKNRWERDVMYSKCKRMLGEDGPKIVSWIREYYSERRKVELYDEFDDEDEDDIVLARPAPEHRGGGRKSRQKQRDTLKSGRSEL